MDHGTDYLKIEEVARMLRVSTRTIYRRIWSGELPASKVGGLYYVRRADIQALLDAGRSGPTGETGEAESTTGVLKCGSCYRLIVSDAQIGELCSSPGCERLICKQCLAEGIETCAQHTPSRQQKISQAQERLQRGEISLMVPAAIARVREMNFLNRLQDRLSRLASLIHPVTSEVLNIPNWDAIQEQSDDRAEVMRILGKVYLDTEALAQIPLNARLRYRIPRQKNQKGLPIEILIQSLSRIPVMLQDGYDTKAFNFEELNPWLYRLPEEAQRNQILLMAVLAATTGWEAGARRAIQGTKPGPGAGLEGAFMHRNVMFYLFDLENSELIYNLQDDRTRQYAELFAPLLPAEELREVIASIEKQMVTYDSLTLAYATETLPFSKTLLQRAFERLAASDEYTVVDVVDIGPTLLRK